MKDVPINQGKEEFVPDMEQSKRKERLVATRDEPYW